MIELKNENELVLDEYIFENLINRSIKKERRDAMMTWTDDELMQIGDADELEIAVRRKNGTLRKPVIIWVVRVGDQLYIRSYMGAAGAWYRAVLASHHGHIRVGGLEKDVKLLEEPGSIINDQVDAAYRSKYQHSPYMAAMVTPEARVTTLKLVPRSSGA
jgi:hypothetical protein